MLSWLKCWFQSFCMGDITVNLKPMETKFPYCCTLKSTKLTQSHLATTVELQLALNTVPVPVVDQVNLGLGLVFWMSWGTVESKWLDMF